MLKDIPYLSEADAILVAICSSGCELYIPYVTPVSIKDESERESHLDSMRNRLQLYVNNFLEHGPVVPPPTEAA
jgi:hypothetical protein